MKKTMILAAFAALISLASCQKEEVIDNGTDKNASPVFTASIEAETKTTLNASSGVVSWEETDEITVTDASSCSAVYKIASIDYSTGRATFEYKSGDVLGAGPYNATYGTEPATSQTYSDDSSLDLYMTAQTSTNSFTFTVQCGLMEINLTKTGESVKSIAVTGTPTGGSETTYTLTCTDPQSIAVETSFYISLPAGSYTKIEITNSSDITCTLTAASGLAIEANHIKPVTFGASKLSFVQTKGTAKATINEVETDVNWIQLWAGGPKFAEFNTGAENNLPEDYGAYISCSKLDTNWGDNWRVPTENEFKALIENCTYEWTTVGGVAGCMFTGKGSYSSNSIFLPAAGYSTSSSSSQQGESGYYLTSDGSTRERPCLYFWLDSYGTASATTASRTATMKSSVRPVLAE